MKEYIKFINVKHIKQLIIKLTLNYLVSQKGRND